MSVTETVFLGKVADDETLYRSVCLQQDFLAKDSQGGLRVSSAAFNDDGHEISLFRHDLCDTPPYSNPPRRRETDFVLSLLASRIRQQELSVGENDAMLNLDVRPDTTNNQHVSHTVVFPSRTISKNAFRKVKRRMAEIVEENWPVPPDPEFVASLTAKAAE